MQETEFEKIIKPVFAEISESDSERIFRTFDFCISEKTGIILPHPWFCANDKEFMNLVENPLFFHHHVHNGLITEYVVTPLFYIMLRHKPDCTKPKTCEETVAHMVNFLFKESKEQDDIIDFMVRNNFYDERLQFSLENNPGEKRADRKYILCISSSPEVIHDVSIGDGIYSTSNSQIKYHCQKHAGFEKISKRETDAFSKIEAIFKKNVARGSLDKQPDLAGVLKEILEQNYAKNN